jgi:hypothetical protein
VQRRIGWGQVRAGRGPARALIALVLLVARAPARAAEPEGELPGPGRALYDTGMVHFRARAFAEAARAFQAAYDLDPRREVLFALAQATRLAGDCPRAVPLYQRFLASGPPARQVEAARIALARCQAQTPAVTSATDGTGVSNATPPAVRPAVTPAPVDVRAAPAWYRDAAAGALATAAVLSVGAGVGLLVAAHRADREHRAAIVYGRADERRGAAQNRQRWATGALVGAAALALAAGGRWAWLRWSAGRAQVGVGVRF